MIKEIQDLLNSEKLLIGTERTTRAMRNGKLKKVFLASNTSEKVKEDIEHYAKLTETEVEVTKENNVELGTICKKSFSISVIGILK